jgi:thiol:disulfide interchange protein DsbC
LLACLAGTTGLAHGANPTAAAAPAATAAAPAANASDDQIRALIKAINPASTVKAVHDSPLPGIKTVIADGTVLYVTNDARYVLYGVLLDTKAQRNLTDEYLSEAHQDVLSQIPAKYKLTFSPKNPKYTITVFTDVTCGYCEALHKNIQSYLDAGIRVDYVPWPRAGKTSSTAQNMRNVWCDKDPQAAFTAAIGGTYPTKAVTCPAGDAVDAMADVGEKLQIEGTPTIFDAHGNKIGGFLTTQAMLDRLQRHDHAALASAAKP